MRVGERTLLLLHVVVLVLWLRLLLHCQSLFQKKTLLRSFAFFLILYKKLKLVQKL